MVEVLWALDVPNAAQASDQNEEEEEQEEQARENVGRHLDGP